MMSGPQQKRSEQRDFAQNLRLTEGPLMSTETDDLVAHLTIGKLFCSAI